MLTVDAFVTFPISQSSRAKQMRERERDPEGSIQDPLFSYIDRLEV